MVYLCYKDIDFIKLCMVSNEFFPGHTNVENKWSVLGEGQEIRKQEI